MKDFIGIFGDGVGRLVQSFLLPAFAGIAVWCFLNFDAAASNESSVYHRLADISAANKLLVLAGVSLVLAFVLGLLTPPAIRLLEGYWPGRHSKGPVKSLYNARQKHHRKKRTEVINELNQSIGTGQQRKANWSANASQFRRFPQPGEPVQPTRLGNVLRAGELYGSRTYQLDTVLMWDMLWAATSDPVREMLSSRRAHLDLVVSTAVVSVVYVAATIQAAPGSSISLTTVLVSAAAATAVLAAAYSAAVQVAGSYADGMVALVETARCPLAEELGLKIPDDVEKERDLWLAVTSRLMWGTAAAPTDAAAWAGTVARARKASAAKS